jgi:hypothetical protein
MGGRRPSQMVSPLQQQLTTIELGQARDETAQVRARLVAPIVLISDRTTTFGPRSRLSPRRHLTPLDGGFAPAVLASYAAQDQAHAEASGHHR